MDDAIHDRIHRQKLLIGNLSGKLQLINSFPITISLLFLLIRLDENGLFAFHFPRFHKYVNANYIHTNKHTRARYLCLVCRFVINNEWILQAPALSISTFQHNQPEKRKEDDKKLCITTR